jgi:DNA-binding MarR family transcriptional regulator
MKGKDVTGLNELLITVFNTILKIEEAALKDFADNLSMTEVHTLAAIGTGTARNMTEVANDLLINVSTLTSAIAKLVAKGYVRRFRSQEDRRVVRIELTEPGIKILNSHEKFHEKMVEQVVESLGEEETAIPIKNKRMKGRTAI